MMPDPGEFLWAHSRGNSACLCSTPFSPQCTLQALWKCPATTFASVLGAKEGTPAGHLT